MSHGPTAQDSSAEPNLTPLLDLVLQLLMFFMICADFKRVDRQNPDLDLPVSQSAVPRGASDKDIISVNLRLFREKDYARTLDETQRAQLKLDFRDAYDRGTERSEHQVLSFLVPRNHLHVPMNATQFSVWLKGQVADTARANAEGMKKPGGKFKPIELAVNIRAPEGIAYEHIYKVREICQEHGIKSVTVSMKTISRGR